MTYNPVAKTTDIQSSDEGGGCGRQKTLAANVDGVFHAMQQRYPHLGANLCRGKLQGNTVTCPLHKATFDLTSGQAVAVAHLLFLKFKTRGRHDNSMTIYDILLSLRHPACHEKSTL